MKINKLYDDLYEIENFMTDNEFTEVFKILNSTPEERWFDLEMKKEHDIPDSWFGRTLHLKEITIFDSINEKMKNLLESYYYYPEKLNISRYKKDGYIQYHSDQWIPDLPYYIGYGFVLYYNDDYEGGELDYPDLKITIKPKANTLYIHGGHIVHGSLPVLNDSIRYFSTVFVRGTEEEPTRLRKDLFT